MYLASSLKRPGSNAPARIRALCSALFGRRADNQQLLDPAGLGAIRYQLVTAAAGALIEAQLRHASQAVLVVDELLSSQQPAGGTVATRPQVVAQNHADLAAFVAMLKPAAETASSALAGPFAVHGGGRVPGGMRCSWARPRAASAANDAPKPPAGRATGLPSPPGAVRFVGVDLAWTASGGTGL